MSASGIWMEAWSSKGKWPGAEILYLREGRATACTVGSSTRLSVIRVPLPEIPIQELSGPDTAGLDVQVCKTIVIDPP